MGVALACTWRPRGEARRWRDLRPHLERLYARIVIVVPHDADRDQARALERWLGVGAAVAPRPFVQRHEALRLAIETAAGHVHYADGDRLLHWAGTRLSDLREAVAAVQRSDCLILGRSEQALGTHPRALRATEAIINAVGSYLLGQRVDLGGGSRGFSRPAAQAVVRHAVPEHFGDAEWPIVAQRSGFRVDSLAVDGLDWETPDHFQEGVAGRDRQRALAEAHDRDPERWASRTGLALRIVREAFAAALGPG